MYIALRLKKLMTNVTTTSSNFVLGMQRTAQTSVLTPNPFFQNAYVLFRFVCFPLQTYVTISMTPDGLSDVPLAAIRAVFFSVCSPTARDRALLWYGVR